VNIAAFNASLTAARPPSGLSPPLEALWWAGKDQWATAHEIAQAHDDRDAAWVHAYLHRVEGDADNAAYWYRRAARPPGTGSLPAEWTAIVGALLAGDRKA